LQVWLNAIGGKITDVEANGQCGRLAIYAAAHNVENDVLDMTPKTIQEATMWKRKILSVLLAKINPLVEAKVIDLATEQGTSYSSSTTPTTTHSNADPLLMYWDSERRRSVEIPVPQSCWVNMTILHGATLFLREPVYVLDVHQDGGTYLGMYAYRKVDRHGKAEDIPFFANIHADKGLQLLETLRGKGVRPVMIVL
ncbi:hypothetical protein PHYSODRAFT_394546, partial [Phytophthora sojae]